MGARLRLGLAGVALVAMLCGCGRARKTADDAAPDTTVLNASAALVDTSAESRAAAGKRADDAVDDCQIAKVRGFVGKPDQSATRSSLAAAVGRHALRWIKPGTAITQDTQPGRLNVIVGEDGRIDSLRCG